MLGETNVTWLLQICKRANTLQTDHRFLPRDASHNASAIYAIVILSVCLSVSEKKSKHLNWSSRFYERRLVLLETSTLTTTSNYRLCKVDLDQRSCSTPGSVTTWMDDCGQVNHLGIINHPTQCIFRQKSIPHYMTLYRQIIVTFTLFCPLQRYYSFCALNTSFSIPHSYST